MGHQKGNRGTRCSGRPQSRRRGYMPEPGDVKSIDNVCQAQVGLYQEVAEHPKRSRSRHSRDKNKSSFNFTHTSCIMAIRNYVERMQYPSKYKKKKNRGVSSQENAEKLIFSLKNDIQMISKYEEDVACNPSKPPASDPFFVLSAMMCKINKLESILLAQPNCKEQLAKRKEMIMMARCIKKTLLDQAQCDNQIMQDKQRKIVCLVKSLDMFERDIRHATRGVKKLCCPKPSAANVAISTNVEKEKSAHECLDSPKGGSRPGSPKTTISITKELPTKRSLDVKPASDPGADFIKDRGDDKQFDITGMKIIYTKSHVAKDNCGGETEKVQNKLSCEVGEEEDCHIEIIKDGNPTNPEDCSPIMKQKMNNLSKLWMESARQLLDACTRY